MELALTDQAVMLFTDGHFVGWGFIEGEEIVATGHGTQLVSFTWFST